MGQEFVPFALERMMSTWEHRVEYNLSESGVHPLSIEELVGDPQVLEDLLSTGLTYPQANGTLELRERIAALYPGATPDNVLVTTGAAQANFTAIWTLLGPGDEIVVMLPNYMQIWGLAQNFRLNLKTFHLKEETGWAVDVDQLNRAVSDKTRLIAVCNPNNPTGHIMTAAEMDAVVAAADRAGAWLLSDEVYAGAERTTDTFTPSFWGRYDRVLAYWLGGRTSRNRGSDLGAPGLPDDYQYHAGEQAIRLRTDAEGSPAPDCTYPRLLAPGLWQFRTLGTIP
jgi:histidinol-phosphate/aromatic aminotransferase/cobyric acid decarboxylase-like protein